MDPPPKFSAIRDRIAKMKRRYVLWFCVLASASEAVMLWLWWLHPSTEGLLFAAVSPFLFAIGLVNFVRRVRPFDDLRATVAWLNRDKKVRRKFEKSTGIKIRS